LNCCVHGKTDNNNKFVSLTTGMKTIKIKIIMELYRRAYDIMFSSLKSPE
jgi:hypothetical protein